MAIKATAGTHMDTDPGTHSAGRKVNQLEQNSCLQQLNYYSIF